MTLISCALTFCPRFGLNRNGIPINDDICWKCLSFTKDLRRGSGAWINMVRSSLKKLSEEDGQYLEMILTSQSSEPLKYALSDSDRKKLWSSVVNSEAGQIAVSIPDDENGFLMVTRWKRYTLKFRHLSLKSANQWVFAFGCL